MIEDVFDAEGIKSNTLAVRARLRLFEVLEQESPGIRSHPPSFDVRGGRGKKKKKEAGIGNVVLKQVLWK